MVGADQPQAAHRPDQCGDGEARQHPPLAPDDEDSGQHPDHLGFEQQHAEQDPREQRPAAGDAQGDHGGEQQETVPLAEHQPGRGCDGEDAADHQRETERGRQRARQATVEECGGDRHGDEREDHEDVRSCLE